jgi:hypothetical protein
LARSREREPRPGLRNAWHDNVGAQLGICEVEHALVRYETERLPRTTNMVNRRADAIHGATRPEWVPLARDRRGGPPINDGLAQSVENGPVPISVGRQAGRAVTRT